MNLTAAWKTGGVLPKNLAKMEPRCPCLVGDQTNAVLKPADKAVVVLGEVCAKKLRKGSRVGSRKPEDRYQE
jgi:hypothetical protein